MLDEIVGKQLAVSTNALALDTDIAGIMVLGEPATAARLACIVLIVAGVAGLKLASA